MPQSGVNPLVGRIALSRRRISIDDVSRVLNRTLPGRAADAVMNKAQLFVQRRAVGSHRSYRLIPTAEIAPLFAYFASSHIPCVRHRVGSRMFRDAATPQAALDVGPLPDNGVCTLPQRRPGSFAARIRPTPVAQRGLWLAAVAVQPLRIVKGRQRAEILRFTAGDASL